jgi:SAM-dependent methyltransferase
MHDGGAMTDIRGPETSARWRDADSHAEAAARYLTLLTDMLAEHKRNANELLRLEPGGSAIEIGCGLGHDSEALARHVGPTGRIVGIDASQALIARAIERTASLGLPLRFQVDDAQALSFPANSFDGARAERVLQHLEDPAQAVRELVRVVRPGGRIAIIEPDGDTISVGGVEIDVTRALTRHKVDVVIAHGAIGRDLRRLLVEAGCTAVMTETRAITFGDLKTADNVLTLKPNLDGACRRGWISEAQRDKWWAHAEALDRAGAFHASMCGVIADATVAKAG